MVLYTKELHLFTFEEWAEGGARISNDGPSYRAAQPPRAISCGLARLPSICHSETYQVLLCHLVSCLVSMGKGLSATLKKEQPIFFWPEPLILLFLIRGNPCKSVPQLSLFDVFK